MRYVLEGSVCRSGGRVRFIAQLIDAAPVVIVWAEQGDRARRRLHCSGRDYQGGCHGYPSSGGADAKLRRILRKPPESLGAWEAYQRGLWHVGRANAAGHCTGKATSSNAPLRSMPPSAPAYAAVANGLCPRGVGIRYPFAARGHEISQPIGHAKLSKSTPAKLISARSPGKRCGNVGQLRDRAPRS